MKRDIDLQGTAAARMPAQRFRLMQYFTVTSFVAFAAVGAALYLLERSEVSFFESVQREQAASLATAQAGLARDQSEAAHANLLAVYEAGHLSLAGLFANALWRRDFEPLLAWTQRPGTLPAAYPGLDAVDARVFALMKGSTVFKIKVYDSRGMTVYSSERSQVGESKADNRGWQDAIKGRPASEIVHRDRFSAFEGMVENRDLIQSYIPVRSPDSGRIAGVFEIYSDVTPFLAQINRAAERTAQITAANQARLEAAAREDARKVQANARNLILGVGAMLALLYVSLLLLVRIGQRIIDEQARAREQAAEREREWHREKMAALAAMAANVSHEVGNPLAVISGITEELARGQAPGTAAAGQTRMILEQVGRIAGMTRQITAFADGRGEQPAPLDVNWMIRSVCDFLGFDRRFAGVRFDLRLADKLPAGFGVPDHLHEVLMSLLLACAEACASRGATRGRLVVETAAAGAEVAIRIALQDERGAELDALPAADARMEAARRRIEAMHGRLVADGGRLEITLRTALNPDLLT